MEGAGTFGLSGGRGQWSKSQHRTGTHARERTREEHSRQEPHEEPVVPVITANHRHESRDGRTVRCKQH